MDASLDIRAIVVNSDTSLWRSMWSLTAFFALLTDCFGRHAVVPLPGRWVHFQHEKMEATRQVFVDAWCGLFCFSQGRWGTAHLVAIAETGWDQWQAHVWETEPLPPCVLGTFCGRQADVAKSLSHTVWVQRIQGDEEPKNSNSSGTKPSPSHHPQALTKATTTTVPACQLDVPQANSPTGPGHEIDQSTHPLWGSQQYSGNRWGTRCQFA